MVKHGIYQLRKNCVENHWKPNFSTTEYQLVISQSCFFTREFLSKGCLFVQRFLLFLFTAGIEWSIWKVLPTLDLSQRMMTRGYRDIFCLFTKWAGKLGITFTSLSMAMYLYTLKFNFHSLRWLLQCSKGWSLGDGCRGQFAILFLVASLPSLSDNTWMLSQLAKMCPEDGLGH